MRIVFLAFGFLIAPHAMADQVDRCIQSNVTVSANNAEVKIDSVGFDLNITNELSVDLGGAIIHYELHSPDRPIALAQGYAQFGVVADEQVTVKPAFLSVQCGINPHLAAKGHTT